MILCPFMRIAGTLRIRPLLLTSANVVSIASEEFMQIHRSARLESGCCECSVAPNVGAPCQIGVGGAHQELVFASIGRMSHELHVRALSKIDYAPESIQSKVLRERKKIVGELVPPNETTINRGAIE